MSKKHLSTIFSQISYISYVNSIQRPKFMKIGILVIHNKKFEWVFS